VSARLRVSAAISLVLLAMAALGQSGTGTSEADRILELRRAELNERQAASLHLQKSRLFTQGLVSKGDLDAAEADLERAHIDAERARVQLANELPSFRIVTATKSIGPTGEIVANVRLEELDKGYAAVTRRGYLVSLKSGDAIISAPYQRQIAATGTAGHIFDLHFQLLRDTDEVTVLILSGTRREDVPILFQRGEHGQQLRITCTNESQTAILGSRADFALQIERFSLGARNYDLRVIDLPPGFTAQWLDVDTKATVARLHFDETQTQRKLNLQVFVPERMDSSGLEKAIAFSAEAGGGGVPAGTLALQLRLTAAPKLILTTENLFAQLAPGEASNIHLRLENAGGAEARDVAFDINAPSGMIVEAQPDPVPVVGARASVPVRLKLSTSPTLIGGEYNVKVQARSAGKYGQIDTPELTLRVEVRTSALRAWILVPVAGLFAACVLAAYWVARAVRR